MFRFVLPLLFTACEVTGVFQCEGDFQCAIGDGVGGLCEPDGHCSFGDFSCLSGRRYDSMAGGVLAGECVGGDVQRCVFDLEIGDASMCARRYDGMLVCWGRNDAGQLSDLARPIQLEPASPTSLIAVAQVRIGERHTCLRGEHDRMRCLGKNSAGQLGNDKLDDSEQPVDANGLGSIRDLDVHGEHTCAVASHDGAVSCWGRNAEGQLGDGTLENKRTPVRVQSTAGDLVGAVTVTTGRRHTCALFDERVACWGSNLGGQLGDGTLESRSSAVEVVGLGRIVEVIAGRDHTCARDLDGVVWCWGETNDGQIGNGVVAMGQQVQPSLVALPGPATAIAIGHDHSCALVDGATWCWGRNVEGQIADPAGAGIGTPVAVAGFPAASRLAAGFKNTCVIGEAGDVWCRGDNSQGQLANGTPSPFVAVPIELPVACGP